MITRLELKNFRVFEKADFELKPLTILVGENGTGKSTILYALCFLTQSLNRVNYRGSIDLRSFDETVRKGKDSFEIGIEVEEGGKRILIQEEFKGDGIKGINITTNGKTLLKAEKECNGVLNFSERAMAEIRSNEDLHKDLTGAIKALNSFFQRIVPILGDRSIFEDSFIVGGHKPEIKEVVKNSTALGNILTWLKRAEEYEKIKELNDAFKQLDCRLLEKPEEEALGQGVIFMEDLSLKTETRGSLTSYGYSKVTPLLASLVLSPEGSTLCIEDPEIHLHPGAQAVLMDLIIKSVKRGERQAIITTHSEHMLIRLVRRIADGAISPEDIAVYYLSKEAGGIEVERVEIKDKGFVSDSFWKFFEEEMRDVFEIKFGGG